MRRQTREKFIRLKITNGRRARFCLVKNYKLLRSGNNWLLAATIMLAITIQNMSAFAQESEDDLQIQDGAFPVSVQFSRVPSGKGWKDEKPPLTSKVQRETIRNIILHGFTNLSIGAFAGDQKSDLLTHAQSSGMKIDFTTNGFEMFGREDPPAISVYSPLYAEEVKKKVAPLKKIERIHSVFPFKDEPFKDEPFHAGPQSFDYSQAAKSEFLRQYGYDMPLNPESVKNDPKKWLDLLNFQSATFRHGWRQVYKILKDFDPRPKVVMTHDSHSTFGAGVKSNSKIAMDDVFHWGGDYADLFIYDIYPYTMFDYRYGELGKLPKPRISSRSCETSLLPTRTRLYCRCPGS